jgi:hypothetical protein
MTLTALVCPACGGSIRFAEAQTDTTCDHCGTIIRLSPGQAVPHAVGLSPAKYKALIMDGRQEEAVQMLRKIMGTDEATLNNRLDEDIAYWLHQDDPGPLASLQAGLLKMQGKTASALILKVVALKWSASHVASPAACRLQMEIHTPGQPPEAVDRLFSLPLADIEHLKPGLTIEVIHGAAGFLSITTPIKILPASPKA